MGVGIEAYTLATSVCVIHHALHRFNPTILEQTSPNSFLSNETGVPLPGIAGVNAKTLLLPLGIQSILYTDASAGARLNRTGSIDALQLI